MDYRFLHQASADKIILTGHMDDPYVHNVLPKLHCHRAVDFVSENSRRLPEGFLSEKEVGVTFLILIILCFKICFLDIILGKFISLFCNFELQINDM